MILLKLRKRFLQWLRETDDYTYTHSGKLVESINEVEVEPMKANWTNAISTLGSRKRSTVSLSDNPVLESKGTVFKLFSAAGGIVIETFYFDERQDQNISSMHVIPESEDLHESLAKIITLEALKK